LASAKWLAWAKPKGVHTEEYMGSFAPKKPASLLDNLKSKFSLLNKPKGFNTGGHIKGPGTATSDSIPAYLSDGEYVIKASSVSKYGTETFDALNAQKFHTGGEVHKHPHDRGPAVRQDPVLARIRKNRYLHGPGLNRDGNPAGWDQIFKKENWEQTANFFGLPAIGRTLQDMKTYGGPIGLATAKFDNAMGNLVNRKGQLPFKSSVGDNLWAGLSVAPIGRPLARGANWLMEKIGKIVPQSVKTGTAKFLASQGIDIFTKISDKLKTFAKPKPIVPESVSSSPVVSSPFELGLTDKLMTKINPEAVAARLSEKYPAQTAQINARLTPNHILRQRFLDIKKTHQPGSPEWEQARFTLALSDALVAQQKNGVIPIMDLKTTPAQKLIDESKRMASTIEEPVTINGKEYLFKFKQDKQLNDGDLSTVENYLQGLQAGRTGQESTGAGSFHVQLIDPENPKLFPVPARIEYDQLSGAVVGRYTHEDYQHKHLSDFLWSKANSISRIRHSRHLTSQGRVTANKIGGFMPDDPAQEMYTSLPNLSVLPKLKRPSLPKLNLSTLKESLGKLTSKIKMPKKTNKTNENITPIDRSSDPNWIGDTPIWPSRNAADTTMSSRAANGYPRASEEARLQREVDQARRGREIFGRSSDTTPTGHHMTDFTNAYLDYLDAGGHMSPLDFLERLYVSGPTRRSTGAASGGLIKNGRLMKGFAMGGLAQSKISIPKYKLPSYEVGSSYIPKDQIAQLHQGERVLTKEENKNYSSSAPTTNIININGSDLNKKEIAQAVMVELDRAQKKNNKTNMVGR
jgi:hypothetical protein